MQQTPTYKLNLIETSDLFSPNPLNENAQKLEAALAAKADAAQSAAAHTALSDSIAAEGSARKSADTTLQNNINAVNTALTNSLAAANSAITAETAARKSADTALDKRAGALESRATALEAHRIAIGSYTGDGKAKTLNLGFTPLFAIVGSGYIYRGQDYYYGSILTGRIVTDGIQIMADSFLNKNYTTYNYFAIV